MRSTRSPRLIPLLAVCLSLSPLLLSTGCVTASTKASRARTERPDLPTRPADLTRTETLKPLVEKAKGDDVTIDRGVLEEIYQRLSEAIGAVERGNNRIAGNNRLWGCVDAIFHTGKAPAQCAKSAE